MSEDDLIKEIAKQLPVRAFYDDAIQPAAKQVGAFGEELMATLRLALFPVQYLAGLQKRYAKFVEKSVSRVAPENRVSPPPQIIGPVLQHIRFEPEGTQIDEMFSELLSTSMNSEKIADAHPSFPSIVSQLSSDEARALVAIKDSTINHVQKFELTNNLVYTKTESDDLARHVAFARNTDMYGAHLIQLGLIRLDMVRPVEPIFAGSKQTGGRNFYRYAFTDFGKSFMRACLGGRD